jgi:hypothetical protein
MASQKSDPLDLGLEGHLPLRKLLLDIFVACWSPSGKHQVVMGVTPHDYPVLPVAVPLAGANRCNIRNWSPGLELEVIGVDQVHPLPSPAQYVE